MRALKMKISIENLNIKHWDEWKREDQDFILDVAYKNNLKGYPVDSYDEMILQGKPEDLYLFLYQVAYRYDVELI